MFFRLKLDAYQESFTGGNAGDPRKLLWLLLGLIVPLASCQNEDEDDFQEVSRIISGQTEDLSAIEKFDSLLIRIKETYQEALAKYGKDLVIDGQECLFIKDPSEHGKQAIVSEGQSYWMMFAAEIAQTSGMTAEQINGFQQDFDRVMNGYLAMADLAFQEGNSGNFAAWAVNIEDNRLVPAPDDMDTPGPLNSAADADFDFINALLTAQQNVEGGIWQDKGYDKLIEEYADYASDKLIVRENGRLLFAPSEDWHEDWYYVDYFSPETALRISEYYQKNNDERKAEFWVKVANDALYIYAQTVVQTGQIPAEARIDVLPTEKVDIELVKEQSWDGVRGAWRIASAIRIIGINNLDPDLKTAFNSYLETYQDRFDDVNQLLQQSMYFPLAVVLGRNEIADQIVKYFNNENEDNDFVYEDLNKYYQTTLIALSLVDYLPKQQSIPDINYITIQNSGALDSRSIERQAKRIPNREGYYQEVRDYGFTTVPANYRLSEDYDEIITSQSITMEIFKAIEDGDRGRFEKLVNTAMYLSNLNYYATDRFTSLLPWASYYDPVTADFKIIDYEGETKGVNDQGENVTIKYNVDGRASASDVDIDLLAALISGFNEFGFNSILDAGLELFYPKSNFKDKLTNFIYQLAADMMDNSSVSIMVDGSPRFLLKTSSFVDTENADSIYTFNFTYPNIAFLDYITRYFVEDYEHDRIRGNRALADYFSKLSDDSVFFIDKITAEFDGLENIWGTVSQDHINLLIEKSGNISIYVDTSESDIYGQIKDNTEVERIFGQGQGGYGFINDRYEITPRFFDDQLRNQVLDDLLSREVIDDAFISSIEKFLTEVHTKGIEEYRYQWRIEGHSVEIPEDSDQLDDFTAIYLPVLFRFNAERMRNESIGSRQQYQLSPGNNDLVMSDRWVFDGNNIIKETTIFGHDVRSYTKRVLNVEYIVEVIGSKLDNIQVRLIKTERDQKNGEEISSSVLNHNGEEWIDLHGEALEEMLASNNSVMSRERDYYNQIVNSIKRQVLVEEEFRTADKAGTVSTFWQSSMPFPNGTYYETGSLKDAMMQTVYSSLEGDFSRFTEAAMNNLMVEAFRSRDVRNYFYQTAGLFETVFDDKDISFVDRYIWFLREMKGMNPREILNRVKGLRTLSFANWYLCAGDLDFMASEEKQQLLQQLQEAGLIIKEEYQTIGLNLGSATTGIRYLVTPIFERDIDSVQDLKEFLTNISEQDIEQVYETIMDIHYGNEVVRALDCEYLMSLSGSTQPLDGHELAELEQNPEYDAFFRLDNLFEQIKQSDTKQVDNEQLFARIREFIRYYFKDENFQIRANEDDYGACMQCITEKTQDAASNLYNYILNNLIEIRINTIIANYSDNIGNNTDYQLLEDIKSEVESMSSEKDAFSNFMEMIAGQTLFNDDIKLGDKLDLIREFLRMQPERYQGLQDNLKAGEYLTPHLDSIITSALLFYFAKDEDNSPDNLKVSNLFKIIMTEDGDELDQAISSFAQQLGIEEQYVFDLTQRLRTFRNDAYQALEQSRDELPQIVYAYENFVTSVARTLAFVSYDIPVEMTSMTRDQRQKIREFNQDIKRQQMNMAEQVVEDFKSEAVLVLQEEYKEWFVSFFALESALLMQKIDDSIRAQEIYINILEAQEQAKRYGRHETYAYLRDVQVRMAIDNRIVYEGQPVDPDRLLLEIIGDENNPENYPGDPLVKKYDYIISWLKELAKKR